MKFPPYLKQNDTIAIICPSGHLPLGNVSKAKITLEEWGFKVKVGKTVGSEYFYFSDNDENRLAELQKNLDDPEVKAIIMGRGGYGLSRIIDQIDFTKFLENPKWICGFSDITVLLSHLQQSFQIACIHGPMANSFHIVNPSNKPHLLYLRDLLLGKNLQETIMPSNKYNKPGEAFGILTGGNLTILAHLTGSISQVDMSGKILFIEDVGEYLYNIDRMLVQLKRNGVFDKISGLICGGFSELKDTVRPYGKSIYQIINDQMKEFNFPVAFDFPAGHIDQNYPLIFGQNYSLQVGKEKVSLITKQCFT